MSIETLKICSNLEIISKAKVSELVRSTKESVIQIFVLHMVTEIVVVMTLFTLNGIPHSLYEI